MNQEFTLEVLTPAKPLLKAQVSEVVLPAYDGEVGVLAEHEDFIGLLGTGALKLVRGGDDYWFMVSSGLYEVSAGKLTVFAEIAEDAKEIDAGAASKRIQELEAQLNDPQKFNPEHFNSQKLEHEQNAARVEVHRRTNVMN